MQNPVQGTDFGPVMHPGSEEWMAYLYGELPAASKATLKGHLRSCPECRASVEGWERTINDLDRWRLKTPSISKGRWVGAPAVKWAMAALLILGIGFGIGRFTSPAPDLNALRAAIEPSLRASLAVDVKAQVQTELAQDVHAAMRNGPEVALTDSQRQWRLSLDEWKASAVAASTEQTRDLFADFNEFYRGERERDHAAILTLFDRAERRERANYISLRRAVETVAVVADDKFQRTENELGQLVSYAQSSSLWDAGQTVNP